MRRTPAILPILALLLLTPPAPARDLPTVETPIGRLSLVVLPDAMVISPDSSRLAFVSKAGDPTLADKGIFFNPNNIPTTRTDDNSTGIRAQVRLYVDDKSTTAYDAVTPVVFSPDSKRFAYAGKNDKKWQIISDNRVVARDADDIPGVPIAYSPDSAHVAYIVNRDSSFIVTQDKESWPPILAAAAGVLTFSPDSKHLAMAARIKTGWTLFVDGKPLPLPPPPPIPNLRPGATQPVRFFDLKQFNWSPDSASLGFFGQYAGAHSQIFFEKLDGTFTFVSKQYDVIANNSPTFSPDSQHLAFATRSLNKWTLVTDTAENPPATAPASQKFDQVRPESLRFTADGKLHYIAQINKKWQLYTDHQAAGDPFDAIIESFVISPDQNHFAFAGTRAGRTFIIKDGAILATWAEAGGLTFNFSPDSQHLAYAASDGRWHACVDDKSGPAYAGLAPIPIVFSPDSSQIAYTALATDKTWRLYVGLNADYQTKNYDTFLKGSRITWRPDGTLVTIAFQKTKVAIRIEAKPPPPP